jgi:hypothetical protein
MTGYPATMLVSYQTYRQLSGWILPPLVTHALRGTRRVEERRGSLGHAATLRFLSPLIKPDVPVSGIRLSDWIHCLAHGSGPRCTRRSRSTPRAPKT